MDPRMNPVINALAMKRAGEDTQRYIKRQGFSLWQLEFETSVQNAVDAYHRDMYHDWKAELEYQAHESEWADEN